MRSSAFTIVGILNEDAEWANDQEILSVIDEVVKYQVEQTEKLFENFEYNDKKQVYYQELSDDLKDINKDYSTLSFLKILQKQEQEQEQE